MKTRLLGMAVVAVVLQGLLGGTGFAAAPTVIQARSEPHRKRELDAHPVVLSRPGPRR
jgi:hypothetical protein